MAKKYAISEVAEAIRGNDPAMKIEIGRKFPLTAILMATNPLEIFAALGTSARKIEKLVRAAQGFGAEAGEDEEEEVEEEVVEKPAKGKKGKKEEVAEKPAKGKKEKPAKEEKPAKGKKSKPAVEEDDDEDLDDLFEDED